MDKVEFTPPRPSFPSFDPIVAHVRSLSYFDCRVFLAKRVKQYPHFQYKYKVLPSERSNPQVRYLRDLLLESRLWLSSPRDFNDPFDMTARVIFEGAPHELHQRFKQLIADKSGLPRKQRKEVLKNFTERKREEWRGAAEKALTKNMSETGICSFAGDPRSVLMWSHYGNHHTGVCLQFEIARDPKILLEAVPLKYVENYPVFNWVKDTGLQMRDLLLHKFKDWKYEGEWRIIRPNGARSYMPFDASALVGLIYGCRAQEAAMEIVKEMLNERQTRGLPPVREYRAEKHGSQYALTIRVIE